MSVTNYENIVNNFDSPTLVLAGPGAGKTYLLADRVKRLLDKGTDKNTITVLTFGTDAKHHMVNELTNPAGQFKITHKACPNISTMHSLGLKIVQKKPRDVGLRKTNLKVQPDEAVKKLMYRDAALILGFTTEVSRDALECKQHGDCHPRSPDKKCDTCRKYWEIMCKCNYLDFDDQILFACRILEKNPNILKKYQSQARHLLVDEYQDINAAQFKLIQLLTRASPNGFFAVGDDAQSIYGFRGADPSFILRFGQDYPNAQIPAYPHSRRCHEKIMCEAIKVLKKYYTDWSGEQKLEFHVENGEKPYIWQLPSEIAEAERVGRIARYFVVQRKTVLILVPKRQFFPLIMKELTKRGVAHDCPEGFVPDRVRIAKLFIDWLKKTSDNFLTRLVIEELMDRGIAKVPGGPRATRSTPKTLEKRIAEETEIAKLWEWVDSRHNLFSVIKQLKEPNETQIKIRDGLMALIDSYDDATGEKKGEFAKQLSVVAGIWLDPKELAKDISDIAQSFDSGRPAGCGFAQLKTMKKAKGLQADVVIIVGLENRMVPNPINDIVEEARLFYVSMTRAKEKLYLFHSFRRPCNISYGRYFRNKDRSGFLDAIGRESEYKKRT